MNPADAFKHALTTRNVFARYVAAAVDREAKEFPSQDALDAYLKDHPQADKSKHTVKGPGGDSKGEEKTDAPKSDSKPDTSKPDAEFRQKLQDLAKQNNMSGQEMVDALGKKWNVEVPGAKERAKEDEDKRKKDPGHDTDQKLNELGRSLGMSREQMAEELRKKWKL